MRLMRLKLMLTAALVVAGGLAIPVALSVSTAAATTSVVTLPIASYSQMLVDPVHQLLFITGGTGSDSVLVTNYSGQTVATIPGQPGATGLALSSDDSTVYVALAGGDAISAISTSTLTQTARYSTGAGTGPTYVAYTSGTIWFGYNGPATGSAGIGSIDPSTSPATVTLNATGDSWYAAPMVTASPDGELVAGEPGQSPNQLASYDVSSGTATVLAPQQYDLSAENLSSFQITPDGADVVTASGYPYYQQVFSVSDLAQVGTYPTAAYPNSVSIASNGWVAAGTSIATNAIFVFAPNDTTPVNTFNFGSNTLAADGAALTPDGSVLFAVTLEGGPTGAPQLNIITDPLLSGTAPVPVTVTVTVPPTGALTVTVAAGTVDLTSEGSTVPQTATGTLNTITVTDSRNTDPGWSVSAQVSAFTGSGAAAGSTIAGDQLGWVPTGTLAGGATLGPAVSPGSSPGLGDAAQVLASAVPGSGVGTDSLSAALTLDIPAATEAGPYTATLTITYMAIGP